MSNVKVQILDLFAIETQANEIYAYLKEFFNKSGGQEIYPYRGGPVVGKENLGVSVPAFVHGEVLKILARHQSGENAKLKMVEFPFEEGMRRAIWGTHGISGKDPIKWVRLIDCSTDHLRAILRNESWHLGQTDYPQIINAILDQRGALQ